MQPRHSSAGTSGPPRDLTGIPVLVVDDQEDTMDVYADILERVGAVALRATGMLEALGIFDRQPIRIVVTDLAMPRGSGQQLRDAIHERRPRIPVVAITGNFGLDAEVVIDQGFAAVLFKPIPSRELIALIWHLTK